MEVDIADQRIPDPTGDSGVDISDDPPVVVEIMDTVSEHSNVETREGSITHDNMRSGTIFSVNAKSVMMREMEELKARAVMIANNQARRRRIILGVMSFVLLVLIIYMISIGFMNMAKKVR
jgi:hypothetical protein